MKRRRFFGGIVAAAGALPFVNDDTGCRGAERPIVANDHPELRVVIHADIDRDLVDWLRDHLR